ncbi:MAG: hypothetical protein CVV52_13135 [Spirochaetae bacterium HGW-Spirochaetae-8]|nr:MAG: hypothetical protein CVV52_13135 [Spirochaetae bacterium HGW-Spirochaetae-8]
MLQRQLVLAINPGSTTTKLALYHKLAELATETIDHEFSVLAKFPRMADQLEFRLELVRAFLQTHAVAVGSLATAMGRGGLLAYCGTRDTRELRDRIAKGDTSAEFYLRALVYQISKEIASHGAVLEGRVDAVVLTGGLAYYDEMMQMIQARIGYLAPVRIIPGEGEMRSLAQNAQAVLTGEREAMEYA